MEKLIHARKLVDFIESNSSFKIISPNNCPYNEHIGALFTDIILQAGLNYKHIVFPRVFNLYNEYPEANTVKGFAKLIENKKLETIISWKHHTKLKRINNLIDYCISNHIDSAVEIKAFLLKEENKALFLNIDGIGSKTYDYFLKLLGVDIVAVDRHIFSFLEKVGISKRDYYYSKSIVEFAADLMDISRRSIDYSIWCYMAYTERKNKH